MRGEFLAFHDQFVGRHGQRGAAGDHGAGAVRAHAKRHPVGIAIDEPNFVRGGAELFMQDLLVHRLVALAMSFGAHQQQSRTAWLKPDLRVFRNRPGGLFDRVHEPDAAQLALGARCFAASGEAVEVTMLQRQFHVPGESAAVIDLTQRRFIRHLLRLDDVAPAQFDAIDAKLVRRGFDDALHEIDRFRPPGAAIRRGRIGVRQHRVDRHVTRRHVIDARQRDDLPERRQQLPVGGDIGPDAGEHVQPHAQEFVVLIQCEFDLADVVAAMLVGHDDLGAFAAPFHRPIEFLRRPQHQPVIDILPALGAKAAADIVDHDAHLAFRHLEHIGGQHVTHPVRIIHIRVQRIAILELIEHAQRAARLHELGMHPRDDMAPPDNVFRFRERRVGGGFIAALERVGDVVAVFVPHHG